MNLEPTIHKNFITESERIELLNHAHSIKLNVNPVGASYGTRNYKRIDGSDYANALVKKIFDRITVFVGLEDPVIDPILGQIVSVINPGGFIHPHVDLYPNPFLKNKQNFRFNLMIDRGDDISYNPVIENKVYVVDKCDAWSFNASKYNHKTEVIKGPENRVVYQFGFMVHQK